MFRLGLAVPALFLALPVAAQTVDVNGYRAQFEKSIGKIPACSTVIDSVNDPDWSKLDNPAYPVICLAPGDYSAKGRLVLRSSGSAMNKRWLRIQNFQGPPWKRSARERAKVRAITFAGSSHWIVHGITVDGDYLDQGAGTVEFATDSGANSIILDSVLIEEGASANLVYFGFGVSDNTVQNSILRNCRVRQGVDPSGVSNVGARRSHIVNNEIYGCVKGIYVSQHPAAGMVIENNDVYVPSSMYTDCAGRFNGTGPCAATESTIGTKNGGTAAEPMRIVHNRIWGNRATDTNVCCAGGGGQGSLVFLGGNGANADPQTTGAKFTLFQNNILMDSQKGISSYWGGVRNNSYIGNIVYNIRTYTSRWPSVAIETGWTESSEYYLNTIIDADRWGIFDGRNNDVRCNVVARSGGGSPSPGGGTQVMNNVFYDAVSYTNGSVNLDVTGALANAATEEYCFYRKLQTGPERVCIPHAQPTMSSPHRGQCATDMGSRKSVGINDEYPIF